VDWRWVAAWWCGEAAVAPPQPGDRWAAGGGGGGGDLPGGGEGRREEKDNAGVGRKNTLRKKTLGSHTPPITRRGALFVDAHWDSVQICFDFSLIWRAEFLLFLAVHTPLSLVTRLHFLTCLDWIEV
jgi:hypothetical protein